MNEVTAEIEGTYVHTQTGERVEISDREHSDNVVLEFPDGDTLTMATNRFKISVENGLYEPTPEN